MKISRVLELAKKACRMPDDEKVHLELGSRRLDPDKPLHSYRDLNTVPKYLDLFHDDFKPWWPQQPFPDPSTSHISDSNNAPLNVKRALDNDELVASISSKRTKASQESIHGPFPHGREYRDAHEISDFSLRQKVENMLAVLGSNTPVMDCLRALQVTKGSTEQAITWLADQAQSLRSTPDAEDVASTGRDAEETTTAPININRGGRPLGSKVVLRRPEAVDRYYSKAKECRDDAAWLIGAPDRKQKLTHIGRIEETDAGTARSPACAPCIKRGATCRVYTAAAEILYAGRIRKDNRQVCARCRFGNSQKDCN